MNNKFRKGKRKGYPELSAPGISTWTNLDDKRIPKNAMIWQAVNDMGCLTAGWFIYQNGKWYEDYVSTTNKPTHEVRKEVLEVVLEQLNKIVKPK